MSNVRQVVDEIDWNQVWRERGVYPHSADKWDSRVASFSEHAIDSRYAADFMDFLQPQADWTVFDMGCGSGTLALPLAKRVKAVTAADFAPKMLDALMQYARERALTNITTLKMSWTDDWSSLPDKFFDISIASRSMLVNDFSAAAAKLIKITSGRIYLALPVMAALHHDLMYQALGRRSRMIPDYLCCYNILYQMGIRANIHILTDNSYKIYKTRAEAVEALSERYLPELESAEICCLKDYIDRKLVDDAGVWRRVNQPPYQCAVIWWESGKR